MLTWSELPGALRNWLTERQAGINVLICGGGALVDALRETDRAQLLSQSAMHWLAIDAMSITARLLATALGETSVCERYDTLCEQIGARLSPATIVFDARDFLRVHEPHLPGELLPQDWSVSSDSITARLTAVLSADEFVLLKSADPPGATPEQLVAAGYVDRHFAEAARTLPRVSCVNLRAAAKAAANLPFIATA